MEDLTTGSISRHLLKTTGFMLVTMVFQTLYFLVDLYWVGRLGKEAIAGVGIAGNLTFIVLAITQMLAVGTTTLISHAAGRKDREQAHRVLNQSLLLAASIGVIFLAVVTALRTAYVQALSPDALSGRSANDYLAWFIPAMALQFPMVVMGAALRGTGNFRPGMVVQTATVIVNIGLAPALMFGWLTGHAMGVAGAGLASLVAIIIGTVWLAMYFVPADSYLKFHADLIPRRALWAQTLKIGLPAGIEFALIAVYLLIVYAVSRPFGAAAQAAFGIGQRILQSGFMPVVALAFAVAPVAGQNFGARHAHRVRETFRRAVLMAASVMLLLTAVCQLAPESMIRFFSSDPGVIVVGAEYLRITSWGLVASGIVFVNGSIFQAMGNTIPPLSASVIRSIVALVPVVMLARLPGFELRWIWYLSLIATILQLALNLLLLRREFRVRLTFGVPPHGADFRNSDQLCRP
jgi:putative MATE family efflux protein